MPEGNEVHRWAERHTAAFAGHRLNVLTGPSERFREAHLIDGKELTRVHAVGKHLGYEFANGLFLHVHLGRFGDWTEGIGPLPEPKGALRVTLERRGRKAGTKGKAQPKSGHYLTDDGTQPFAPGGVDWAQLRGPTDCSIYDAAKWAALLDRIGPDPLGEDPKGHDDPKSAFAAILSRKTSIGELLMDQEVLSGVGNIYRAEVLFRHRVNPFTPGEAMDEKQLRAIWKDLGPLLRAGMIDRRIVCTKRGDRPSRKEPAPKGEEHYVYRRHGKPCFLCGEPILRRDVAGRTLYWCPKHQATTEAENRRAYAHGTSLRAARAEEKQGRTGVLTD